MAVKRNTQLPRMRYFEDQLFWFGRASRKSIETHFNISGERASAAIQGYLKRFPENAYYDTSERIYKPFPNFNKHLGDSNPDSVLGHLLLQDGYYPAMPDMQMLPLPARAIPVETLRVLLAVIAKKGSLDILYQSMSRPEPTWRRISPHAFGTDGSRWHVRAWNEPDGLFKDFVLGRIVEAGVIYNEGIDPKEDHDWHALITFEIGPDPRLEPGPQAAIERDFCMEDGKAVFEIRRAMRWYVAMRWNLIGEPFDDPRRQQIVLLNPEALVNAPGEVHG